MEADRGSCAWEAAADVVGGGPDTAMWLDVGGMAVVAAAGTPIATELVRQPIAEDRDRLLPDRGRAG